jgi:hypoxanthine phosphoribosyltransferase
MYTLVGGTLAEEFMPQPDSTPVRSTASTVSAEASSAAASALLSPNSPPSPAELTVGSTTFAHRAEAEFARLLDFYGIEWRYEPDTFPLQWADDGHVTQQFSPDFYLPEYDLYIELTVMKQSLVRRKNRKLRRLRELHPEIQIKLLYRRDFSRLVAGLGFPVEALGPGDEAAATAGRAA